MSSINDLKQQYRFEDWEDSDAMKGVQPLPRSLITNTKYSIATPDYLRTYKKILANAELMDRIRFAADTLEKELPTLRGINYQEELAKFGARYAAQMRLDGEQAQDYDSLFTHLREFALELVIKHFPIYALAFRELDELRATRPNLTEVYIGRDGRYAFIARHATWESNKHAFREPLYIVYPRLFIKLLDNQQKRQYVSDSGIHQEEDIILFDLCYKGTVPEDILKTLGYSANEIDDRIFMLSAKNPKRQFKSIPRILKDEIANMQYTPKTEQRELGLKTTDNGTLMYAANPACPEDQFYAASLEYLVRYLFPK